MFESLSSRFEEVFTALRSRGRLRPADVDAALGEIRRALLEADVSLSVVSSFVERVRQKALETDLSKVLNPAQQVLKIVHGELSSILGGETAAVTYASKPPTVVLLAGLQGSGKTTAAAKLALWFRAQGRRPLLVGTDFTRPAAVEQLRTLGEEVGVPVCSEPAEPAEAASQGLEEARRLGRDVLICDTAGRQIPDDGLMAEMRKISENLKPHHSWLVLDAMTGQVAAQTGERFHSVLGLDGLILSKLDGDARGGAALSLRSVLGVPIVFASTGERIADLERFHPDRMAGRILGMGDILTLAEKAEQTYEAAEANEMAERMLKGRFTLEDFLSQLRQMRKMGGVAGVLSHMPKLPAARASEMDERSVDRMEAIICSMTPEERSSPNIVSSSRRRRIAAGSGTTPAEVSNLLRNFSQASQTIRRFGKAGSPSPARKGKVKRRRSARTTPLSGPISPRESEDFVEALKRLG